jgi:tetratricopeptide (TPR) repeat protein
VRDVPVLDARGEPVAGRPLLAEPATLRALVARSLGDIFPGPAGTRLSRYLDVPANGLSAPPGVEWHEYPYRYRGLDALLDRALPSRLTPAQADALGDLGGLLTLAKAADVHPNAGQLAFAILHRARAAGGCPPQLNLAYLVAASPSLDGKTIRREFRAAEQACAGDPTPAWLRGQWESVRGDGSERAVRVFRRLQRQRPGSAAGYAGEADAQLRLAYADDGLDRTFTARSRYRRALSLYRRARTLSRDPGLVAGEGRALAGVGQHAAAAGRDAAAARALGTPALLQVRVVRDLEHAGRFAAAAVEARRLVGAPRFPGLPALFFSPEQVHGELADQDALEPLSLGAGRLRGATLDIAPRHAVESVSPVASEALGILPVYRPDELSLHAPWCADFSARRDLILAGRPRAALPGLPTEFTDAGGGSACELTDAALLAVVARAEAGDVRGAVAQLRRDSGMGYGRAVRVIADRRQNLWRFAGRYDRAAAVAAAFARARPRSPIAYERLGEIAFLRRAYGESARFFGRAARNARAARPDWSPAEAINVVKRGIALRFAGRQEAALPVLAAAEDVGVRAASRDPDGPASLAVQVAREQTGNAYLRLRRYDEADEAYDAAREVDDSSAVLDNNQAIARLKLGRARSAVRLARRAVASDPRSPVFLETLGSARARAGDHRGAAVAEWRALRSDPSMFSGWNNLGVALARLGRQDAAIAAFRRAVGSRRSYATGWFNLGVTLERAGLRHALAAQGAFARAVRLDGELADRRHALVLDERVYFANLDLSKPLPPRWKFAADQKQAPLPSVGLAVILLLGLRLTRGAAGRGLPGGTQRWLELVRDAIARLPRALAGFSSWALAVAATVAVFAWPVVRGRELPAAALIPLALGVLVLIAMIARARVLAARRAGVTLRQRSWRPALLVALAGAALGVPWAPLPVADTSNPAPAVHASGPVVAGAAGLVLFVLGAWLHIAATEALGLAAVVMAASMLTPVPPLDGARMGGGVPVAAGLGLVGVVVLTLLGLQ